jgi:ankyrin repeat protein
MKKALLILMTSVCISILPANSQPPLHKAVILHDLKTVKKLIDEGSDVNEHSRYCSPLMIAVGHKDPEMVELLLKNGAKSDTCKSTYIFQPSSNFVGEFEFSERLQILFTPFYYAIKLNQFDIVKLFCENGYDISKKMGGLQFTYPIIAAAKFGRTDMLNYLLEKGVDITVKDNNGKNALMYAAPSGNLEITYLLLQKGCSVNDTSNNGYTPLMYAVKAKGISKEIINILINKGADLNFNNIKNESAFSLECLSNNRALALFLFEHGAKGKDSNSEIESNARMNHFLGDFYLAMSELQVSKDYYAKAKLFYNESIQKEKQEITKIDKAIKKEKVENAIIDASAYVAAYVTVHSLAVMQANQFGKDIGMTLTKSQRSILVSQYTDNYLRTYSSVYEKNAIVLFDYELPEDASLEEQKIFYVNKITQFEMCIDLIDAIFNCIEKRLTGDELINCIHDIQLSKK